MSTPSTVRVGIIGGSGLYQMPELTGVEEVKVDTPFGPPSDAFIVGTLEGERVAFLPRHGRGHRLTPTEVAVSRQHLRDETARSGEHSLGFGSRIVAGEICAARHGDSRSVF